ncbi:MAG TPA: hypothetical protein VNT99_20365 [Methylomirabilota bacterium]|nr:hypothetical protein [Methylomirabilota bacterium]
MHQDIERFLNLRRQPAQLTVEEAARNLGFSPHDIPILVAKGMLKPLGHPPANAQKYFLTAALDQLHSDEKWFSKARDTLYAHWRYKNGRKRTNSANGHSSVSENPLMR